MKRTTTIIFLMFPLSYLWCQDHPGARDHLAFGYSFSKNQLILYGGSGVENQKYTWNGDLWSWSRGVWKNENNGTPGKITSMSTISMPHDSSLLMMGGVNPEKGDLNETWVLKDDEWKLYRGNGPSQRLSPAMAYDPIKKVVVLFSGCAGNNYPSDTWEWNGKEWIQKSSDGPEGLCRASLFYDMHRGSLVLFGGANSEGKKKNDMYEWNGATWALVNQGNNVPEPRSNILIAYDENRKRAVLLGGSGNSGILDDLWEWDGRQWHRIQVQEKKPDKREVYGITYHPVLKKIFLYGGRSGFAKPFGDLWSWDGKQWELQ